MMIPFKLMNILFIIGSISLASSNEFNHRSNCQKLAEKIDYRMKVASLATQSEVLANENGVDYYCSSIEKMINGVRRYRQLRCAGPVTLISLGIALMNFNQLNHRACHTERDKTEDILSCLPESNLRGIAQCWADYSGAIQMAVAPPVPDIQMFSIMCCSHRRLIRCLHRQVPEKCPGSRVQARKLMLDMLDQLGNDFFSMACGRWDNERCMTSGEYAQLDSMHFEPSDQDPAFLFIPIMNFTAKLSFDPFKEHSRPL